MSCNYLSYNVKHLLKLHNIESGNLIGFALVINFSLVVQALFNLENW